MKKSDIIFSIKHYGNVCLKPSKVCDGVGVFALIDIPAHTPLFGPNLSPDTLLLTWEELSGTHPSTLSYLKSICNTSEQGLYLSRPFNQINVSYYINHSPDPNVHYDRQRDYYFTIQYIHAHEELVCIYDTEEMDWLS